MASPLGRTAGRAGRLRRHPPSRHRSAPFTGRFNQHWQAGQYHCIRCGAALFTSETKFDAGCGWPSFTQALPQAIAERADRSHGMVRVETLCSQCGAHLGHVFPMAQPPRACATA